MCGRYASVSGRPELLEAFDAADATGGEPLEPDHNVAPTKPVPAVLTRRPRGDGAEGREPERQLRVLRWGLVPSWARDPGIGSRLINARVETVADKPAFRAALGRRRCLLPALGYFEWQPVVGPGPSAGRRRPGKQPYFLSPADGSLLVMAGLYEVWADRAAGPQAPRLWTCTIVTGDAVDELGHIHDRSPRLVAPADWAAWLDPSIEDPAAVLPLLRPAGPGQLTARPVSTAVNDVASNGPHLLDPLPLEPVPPRLDLPADDRPGRAPAAAEPALPGL